MPTSLGQSFVKNFLGHSPLWYKKLIIAFLVINPVLFQIDGFIAGWALIIEFIFTLAMALKCYPLQPGGLLAIEAMILGMTTPQTLKEEIVQNFPVILLLMFMVAGIYFMRELLLFTFTKLLLGLRSKPILSVLFCAVSAFLSAFLDALTVTAVIISVCTGFYAVYHKVASGKHFHHDDHDHSSDHEVIKLHHSDLEGFRSFLRSLLMHAAIGTALGGVCTTVGEPQNLLIAGTMNWDFLTFFQKMLPVTLPVLVAGLITCFVLEKVSRFGYGEAIPEKVFIILEEFDLAETEKRNSRDDAKLIIQAISALLLMIALSFHLAEVGLIGLGIIVIQTAFNGITDEHAIGPAFEEAMPFTSLLVVFFAIVAVIHDQHLFSGIIHAVLSLPEEHQTGIFFLANGLLSMISDNVFVATVYISEVKAEFDAGNISRAHFEKLAIAINTGTNLPSVATPNGQAAFLFLLTSALAPLIRLSYGRMVVMALPYTAVLGSVGYVAIVNFI